MGGRNTFTLAVEEPTLAAAGVYYGATHRSRRDREDQKAPMLGNFGGDDEGPSPLRRRSSKRGRRRPGAPHTFANPNNPWKGYRKDAAGDARTTAFLRHYLIAK